MSAEFPHLTNAPIREALLDIKVEPRDALSSEELAAFGDKVKEEFPEASSIVQTEFDVSSGEQGVRSRPPKTLGTICWNESKTRAVQSRLDGFTLNYVQSYESWDILRERPSAFGRTTPPSPDRSE